MTANIARYSSEIVSAQSSTAAISLAMQATRDATGAAGTGVYLLKSTGLEIYALGIPERIVDRYLSCFGPEKDPLLRHILIEHTAVHNGLLFSEKDWKKQPLFELAMGPSSLSHYLIAPILSGGDVVGAVTSGRRDKEPFGVKELLRANTLSAYLSARLARETRDAAALEALALLSSRERDVALFLVKGCTNHEIATNEQISINYVKKLIDRLCKKFDASNRTELAAKLATAMP